ncbi:MAG: hypothetical protein JXA04_07170 [Gammaproteobacteria bacterium]|nr:hypothetical protein [Gammaproteobacteria bacterium]
MHSGFNMLRRLKFYAGNSVRFLSIPWKQSTITPDIATTLFGCNFGNSGWHHIRKTLEEYDADNSIHAQNTTLSRYLEKFCPDSISILAGIPKSEIALPLFVYPWGSFREGEIESKKNVWESRFCGPSTKEFISKEFERTISLYRHLKSAQYSPWRYGHTFIGGTMLVAKDGCRRFIVLQGNHRMAIISHLRQEKVAVRPIKGWLATIRECDVQHWPLVRTGLCSLEHALCIFRYFFENNGHHVSKSI